jgi:hypothetical protein
VVIAVSRYRFRQQIGAALDDPRVPELARQADPVMLPGSACTSVF